MVELLASVDDTIKHRRRIGAATCATVCGPNTTSSLPAPVVRCFLFRHWLDMPDAPLPGDLYTPRVHWGAVGPSERMIVSP